VVLGVCVYGAHLRWYSVREQEHRHDGSCYKRAPHDSTVTDGRHLFCSGCVLRTVLRTDGFENGFRERA
jgi:hypothetical protein